MTDMIAAEPALAGRILARLADPAGDDAARLAAAIRATVEAGDPVVVTGCGTSEHGAQAAAEILREAAVAAGLRAPGIRSEQAFELSLAPPDRGLVIGVSHEGGTVATRAALQAARDAGRPTAVITVSRRLARPGPSPAIVVETGELDQGWCHTVGYLSPILAASAVGAHLSGRPIDPSAADTPARRRRARHGDRRGDRRRPRRRRPPARHRVGRRPSGRARARPQGRGSLVAAVRLPRPRDVPPRAPARDGHQRPGSSWS